MHDDLRASDLGGVALAVSSLDPPAYIRGCDVGLEARAMATGVGGVAVRSATVDPIASGSPDETTWRRLLRSFQPVLRHRLFQFAFFGGLIFSLAPKVQTPESIEITSARLAALRAAEVSRGGGKAVAGEHDGEVDQRELEDELLYREGVRLGLDKNDGIVRQRVVQKVLFLAEEMAGASRPADEAGLRAFFDQNQDRWAIGEGLRFKQIYRHDQEVLAAWAKGSEEGDPPTGEPAPIARDIDETRSWIATELGSSFADALAAAPVGRWAGPIRSTFGWHLVRVSERRPARPARLDEVRAAVVEAYSVFRRQEATAAFLSAAFARYKVAVDGRAFAHFRPSRRVAFRSVSSGED